MLPHIALLSFVSAVQEADYLSTRAIIIRGKKSVSNAVCYTVLDSPCYRISIIAVGAHIAEV